MNLTRGKASIAKNCYENENDVIILFKSTVLNAIKTITDKKKRTDKESTFDYPTNFTMLPSNIEMQLQNMF